MRRSRIALCLGVIALGWGVPCVADGPSRGTERALIVVGLPGDAEHRSRFAETVHHWRAWLTGPLGFEASSVHVLGDPASSEGTGRGVATRDAIEQEAAALRRDTKKDDRLWVFWLGHASPDDKHVWLHLPGPDLRDDQFGALFQGIEASQQVFWMTSAGSGWMVRSLSAPRRIVIAATERDDEFNETEFPEALATVAGRSADKLDSDHDGQVSVLEVYRAVVAEVDARYSKDMRVPTEHAQIDDNGDGVGTELPKAALGPAPTPAPTTDGFVAAFTRISRP